MVRPPTLVALGLLVAGAASLAQAGGSYPDCAEYELANTFELGAGIKVDGDGRFVIYVPNGLMDYVVWDEPSFHAFPGTIFAWHGYVEDNGVPDLQRYDWECLQDPWNPDTQVW